MSNIGPITQILKQDIHRCLEAIHNGTDVSRVFIDFSSYVLHAVDQLESQLHGLPSSKPRQFNQFGEVPNMVVQPTQELREEPTHPFDLTLDQTWDSYLCDPELPRIFNHTIPHEKRTNPKYVPFTGIEEAIAKRLNLPLPQQIGHHSGHPFQVRLAAFAHSPHTIHVVWGRYTIGVVNQRDIDWAHQLMRRYDTPCIQLNASIYHGKGDIWRIVYYL